jgi:hypothetical protein
MSVYVMCLFSTYLLQSVVLAEPLDDPDLRGAHHAYAQMPGGENKRLKDREQ